MRHSVTLLAALLLAPCAALHAAAPVRPYFVFILGEGHGLPGQVPGKLSAHSQARCQANYLHILAEKGSVSGFLYAEAGQGARLQQGVSTHAPAATQANRPGRLLPHLQRVAGDPGDRPFADVEKEHFVALLHRLSQLYAVEVVGYTRPIRWRGALWAGRFKHTLLEEGVAVWDCWQYIALNPVRAGLVADPADYRFSDFGAWCGSKRHPFAANLDAHIMPCFKGLLHVLDQQALHTRSREAFAWQMNRHQTQAVAEAAVKAAGKPLPFSTVATRRMRY